MIFFSWKSFYNIFAVFFLNNIHFLNLHFYSCTFLRLITERLIHNPILSDWSCKLAESSAIHQIKKECT